MEHREHKEHKPKLNSGWVAIIISVLTSLFIAGIAWGINCNKISNLEKTIDINKTESDKFIDITKYENEKRIEQVQEYQEKMIDQMKNDHDLLIQVNTKLDLMMKDLMEVKGDLKKHIQGNK